MCTWSFLTIYPYVATFAAHLSPAKQLPTTPQDICSCYCCCRSPCQNIFEHDVHFFSALFVVWSDLTPKGRVLVRLFPLLAKNHCNISAFRKQALSFIRLAAVYLPFSSHPLSADTEFNLLQLPWEEFRLS